MVSCTLIVCLPLSVDFDDVRSLPDRGHVLAVSSHFVTISKALGARRKSPFAMDGKPSPQRCFANVTAFSSHSGDTRSGREFRDKSSPRSDESSKSLGPQKLFFRVG